MFFFDETDHGYMCMWQGGRAHIYHTCDAWIVCEDGEYWFFCSHYPIPSNENSFYERS